VLYDVLKRILLGFIVQNFTHQMTHDYGIFPNKEIYESHMTMGNHPSTHMIPLNCSTIDSIRAFLISQFPWFSIVLLNHSLETSIQIKRRKL
jgi:hypothetical protein